MNYEEIQSLIDQLKASGLKDEEIMDVFWTAFSKGEMDRKDLETLAEAMGYELTDDFKNDEQPDPINSGADENAQGLSEKELEDAKAIEPGETVEDFKEKIDETPKVESESDEEEDSDEYSDSEEDEDEDEEEGWKKAQKLFKI